MPSKMETRLFPIMKYMSRAIKHKIWDSLTPDSYHHMKRHDTAQTSLDPPIRKKEILSARFRLFCSTSPLKRKSAASKLDSQSPGAKVQQSSHTGERQSNPPQSLGVDAVDNVGIVSVGTPAHEERWDFWRETTLSVAHG
jgi:hypothetical protein